MFDRTSDSPPSGRDDAAADTVVGARGSGRQGEDVRPAESREDSPDEHETTAQLTEALLAQVPRAPSTYELVKAPLPPDHPNPSAVRSDGEGGTWVDVLDQPPGPGLLTELIDVHPAALGDLDLLAALGAWERAASWLAARHGEALGALLARADRFGGPGQLAAILATEVGYTQRAAQDRLAWANTLGTFPQVAAALENGQLDVAKAKAICDEALNAPDECAAQVADLGLALAPRKTPPQLRRALRAALIGLDPGAAAQRAERQRAERRVEFHPLPDAMALISAYLPATDAMAVKTALDALARTTGTDDPRTFDQRRADYLAAIFHAICDAGEAPLAHPPHHDACPAGDTPPMPPVETAPHLDEVRPASDAATTSQGTGAAAQLEASPIQCGPQTFGHVLWRRLATNQRQRPHLQITIADTTLRGLDDRPADLTGYGPIPADLARLLATDATWRALYTDRAGTITAVGERTYRPGAVLTRQVAARDRTCTFTGCTRPAIQCDIDHRTPFTADRPAVEQTHLDNLHALCRFHHNLKTLHGWTPHHDAATGVTSWQSPLGTRHERDPEPPLPPWESWLEDLARSQPTSPCPCNTAARPREPEPPLPDDPPEPEPPLPDDPPEPEPPPPGAYPKAEPSPPGAYPEAEPSPSGDPPEPELPPPF